MPTIKQVYLFQKRKRRADVSLLFLTENLKAQSFGRELVFSADLCYNEVGDENG